MLDQKPQNRRLDERGARTDDDEPIETDHRRAVHYISVSRVTHEE